MSRSVWKFEVPNDDEWHEVLIPQPGRVLHVGSLQSQPAIWAEVTPGSDELYPQRFRVFGTGQPIPARSTYVGTTLTGPFVWHVYAQTPGMFGKYEDQE